MAAPTPTARQTPGGLKLEDGFPSKITFSADPDISLFEITTKPPGIDYGDKINTTTMHNNARRTYALRKLYDVTDSSLTCAYDPAVYTQILAMRGVKQTITQTFADGSTICDYGAIKSFEPGDMKEGEMPTATVVINYLGTDSSGAEQAPVVTSVAGT